MVTIDPLHCNQHWKQPHFTAFTIKHELCLIDLHNVCNQALVIPLCQQKATVLVQHADAQLHHVIAHIWLMNLCGGRVPIRYFQLQARLLLLVWKEWYSSRSPSSGEGSCQERRMHGTRPSFYGNKRNLRGVGRGKEGWERKGRWWMCWNVF